MCSCTLVKVAYGAVYTVSEGNLLFGFACVPSGIYFTLATAAVVHGMERYA